MAESKKGIKTIAENRQARHEYFILESIERVLNCSAPK